MFFLVLYCPSPANWYYCPYYFIFKTFCISFKIIFHWSEDKFRNINMRNKFTVLLYYCITVLLFKDKTTQIWRYLIGKLFFSVIQERENKIFLIQYSVPKHIRFACFIDLVWSHFFHKGFVIEPDFFNN